MRLSVDLEGRYTGYKYALFNLDFFSYVYYWKWDYPSILMAYIQATIVWKCEEFCSTNETDPTFVQKCQEFYSTKKVKTYPKIQISHLEVKILFKLFEIASSMLFLLIHISVPGRRNKCEYKN